MEEKKHKRGHHKTAKANYRNDALKAVKDLRYGPEVITKIEAAKSDAEIERIMNTARNMSR